MEVLKEKSPHKDHEASNDVIAQPSPVDLRLLLTDTAVNIIGIIGNLLNIAHIKDPLKHLRSLSSLFIFNIAVIDLLISCVLVIYQYSYHIFAVNSDAVAAAIDISDEPMGLLYCVSLSSYLSWAIERLWSVVFPLWLRVKITESKCPYFVARL